MKRLYYLFFSLVLLLCSQTTFSHNCNEIVPYSNDTDSVCGVSDIWELEWFNELTDNADGSTNTLWAGHTNNTGSISFQGLNNNINSLFFEVLTAPNNTSNVTNYIYDGYNEGDINMDGSTIYQGNNSDANSIFFTTIQHPQNNNYIANFTIFEQMP